MFSHASFPSPREDWLQERGADPLDPLGSAITGRPVLIWKQDASISALMMRDSGQSGALNCEKENRF